MDLVQILLLADVLGNTVCKLVYLLSQVKKLSADLSLVIGNYRLALSRHLSKPGSALPSDVMAMGIKQQVIKEHEMNAHFLVSNREPQWLQSSKSNQYVFVANQVTEIQDTIIVSQFKHVSGI